MFSECSGLEPRAEGAERNWHRAWVAALVPRRGRPAEGEGDPLKGCGLPLPLGLAWDFIPFCSEENPYTIFCRPLGVEWETNK